MHVCTYMWKYNNRYYTKLNIKSQTIPFPQRIEGKKCDHPRETGKRSPEKKRKNKGKGY